MQRQYQVPGISCEHCVRAITSELSEIDGVDVVEVSIPTKVVTVQKRDDVSDDAILAGINEAGFEEATALA